MQEFVFAHLTFKTMSNESEMFRIFGGGSLRKNVATTPTGYFIESSIYFMLIYRPTLYIFSVLKNILFLFLQAYCSFLFMFCVLYIFPISVTFF